MKLNVVIISAIIFLSFPMELALARKGKSKGSKSKKKIDSDSATCVNEMNGQRKTAIYQLYTGLDMDRHSHGLENFKRYRSLLKQQSRRLDETNDLTNITSLLDRSFTYNGVKYSVEHVALDVAQELMETVEEGPDAILSTTLQAVSGSGRRRLDCSFWTEVGCYSGIIAAGAACGVEEVGTLGTATAACIAGVLGVGSACSGCIGDVFG